MSNIIGIRREDKSVWEKRVPLVPHDVEKLIRKHGVSFVVQPALNRAYPDGEYASIGTKINEDLSGSSIVVGVKEFPCDFIWQGGTYVFFSHTIKGQRPNIPMLKRLVEMGCTLIDYELVKDADGRRLIFFGHYAGRAGMIDTLWALGRRLDFLGFKTPFLRIKQAYKYLSMGRAKDALRELAHELNKGKLPQELRPMIFGIAGYGNVSKGAQVILDILEPTEVDPLELDRISPHTNANGIYKVVFKEEHIVVPRDPESLFELQDYYRSPQKYRSVFERYTPHLTVLMNCNYWDEKYPRLLTKDSVHRLFSGNVNNKLQIIGDISCDIEGGIECTTHCTQPDNPVYVYDVDTDSVMPGWEGNGPCILAVDNLPAEFPWESSMYFSGVLKNYIPALSRADFDSSFEALRLPNEIKNAIILYKGKFTPDFKYMESYLG